MKVILYIKEEDREIRKKLIGIDEIDIRKGNMDFWVRDNDLKLKIELSIPINQIVSMTIFKIEKQKENLKKKQKQSKIKNGRVKPFHFR